MGAAAGLRLHEPGPQALQRARPVQQSRLCHVSQSKPSAQQTALTMARI